MEQADPTREALGLIERLASGIGPRRPSGRSEAEAADLVAGWLAVRGVEAETRPLRGLATFAGPQALAPALALASAAAPPGSAPVRALALAALAGGLAEGDPRLQPFTRLLARGESRNLVASVEPRERPERTLCLVSHLDSSRSGLLFHPALAPHLRRVIDATSLALLVRCLCSLTPARSPVLRLAGGASTAVLAGGMALLAERELRGRDVPGANDNASGVAVAATITCELAARPLERTRLVFLATGCEESGTVGMRSFLEANDTSGWLFLNLDGVGAPATLRYLPREGVGRTWRADPGLVRCAEALAERRPELGLAPAKRLVGLTYDATQVLARGGRALTLSAQDETIPNYHTETDTTENIDREVLARALEVVRELVAAVDRGEAG